MASSDTPLRDPAQILRDALVERVARNPAYSMRAFARNLGVSHAYLSMILSGKRRIPLHQAERFRKLAAIGEQDGEAFVASCRAAVLDRLSGDKPVKRPVETRDYFRLRLEDFRHLAGWQHVAILDLTELSDFRSEPRWIAKRLGLTTAEVRQAIARLVRLGMLSREKPWKKIHTDIEIVPARSESHVRQYHFQMMRKAMEEMTLGRQEDFTRREIGATTMAVNPERLEEARRRIRRFRKSLLNFVGAGKCTELYQLNLQFFPLTRRRKK